MKQHQASETAERVAMGRAIESRRPADVRICYDPFAEDLLGRKLTKVLNSPLRMLIMKIIGRRRRPGLFYYIVSRCRYVDDYLQNRIDNGLQQLVILGAGYDSRAYRFDELSDRVKVFELDHPATQAAKIEKLGVILNGNPHHVTFIPVDFDNESFGNKLFENGYDRNLNTLFICEGVTYYISAEAVNDTLAFVAKNSCKGSSIIFDFVPASIVTGSHEDPQANRFAEWLKKKGEPVQFGIDPELVEQFLIDRGFQDVKSVFAKDLKSLYFCGINEEFIISEIFGIVTATVAAGE